jgi:hypothetical protein
MSKTLLAGASLAIVLTACGGPMTATEYVDALNALVESGRSDRRPRYELDDMPNSPPHPDR